MYCTADIIWKKSLTVTTQSSGTFICQFSLLKTISVTFIRSTWWESTLA